MHLQDYIKNELEMYCFMKNPRPEVPFLPSNVYIEPTNACNLRCIMCARENMDRRLGNLKLSEFKTIIDKFADSDWYPPITLTGNGEALLNKALFSMITHAKERGFNVSLISNSTLLDEEKTETLLSSGLDRYQTMFDSIDKESFEELRKGADYEKTKAKIIRLIEENEQMGHPVFISIGLIKTSLTKRIEETKAFWECFPIDNFYLSPLFSLQADSGLYEEAIMGVDRTDYKVCIDPWINMSVNYNGEVTLCPMDFNNTYPVGNILHDSIEEIWNSNKAQKLRRALLQNDLSYFSEIGHDCAKCNVPYCEYGIKDYLDSIPSRIERKIRTFHDSERK